MSSFKVMRLPSILLSSALLFFLVISPVQAAETITSSCSIPNSRLDWRVDQQTGSDTTKYCDIDQFDESLGNLTGVTIAVTGNTETVQKMENKDVTPHQMESTVTVDVDFFNTTKVKSLLTLSIPAANASLTAEAFDGDVDFAGTSGQTFEPEYAQNSNSISYTDEKTVSSFIGDGALSFPVDAIATWGCSGSGNAACAVDTYASAAATVTYTYELRRPDLVVNSCVGGDLQDGETGTLALQAANQGEASISEPIDLEFELPACLDYQSASGSGWDCSSTGQSVSCEFLGVVPINSFVPELTTTVTNNNCTAGPKAYPVSISTPNETFTQNNSATCQLTALSTPEVLGDTDKKPTPSPTPTDVCTTFVRGHVFEDLNKDGVQDVGEPDLANVTVTITDVLGSNVTVETDQNGDYELCVEPGTVIASVDMLDPDLPTNPFVTTRVDGEPNDVSHIQAAEDKKTNIDDVGLSNDDGSVLASLADTGLNILLPIGFGAVSLITVFVLLWRRRQPAEVE